ncbi:MAG: hypothetical protein IJI24_01460 [Lachnospiraceae bacterium]|nr:hypothetical protein [Lachnospiraceae bacterium]
MSLADRSRAQRSHAHRAFRGKNAETFLKGSARHDLQQGDIAFVVGIQHILWNGFGQHILERKVQVPRKNGFYLAF